MALIRIGTIAVNPSLIRAVQLTRDENEKLIAEIYFDLPGRPIPFIVTEGQAEALRRSACVKHLTSFSLGFVELLVDLSKICFVDHKRIVFDSKHGDVVVLENL